MSTIRTAAGLALALAALALPGQAFAQCDPTRYYDDPSVVTTGPNPVHPVLADFNEDGNLDLAVTNSNFLGSGNGSVAVFLGDGAGGFGPPLTMPMTGQPHFIAVGDFNGDDILDLATTRRNAGMIDVQLGNGTAGVGDGTFAGGVPYATAGGTPFQIVTGDYDEDGDLDLAVALNNLARVAVLLGNGDGTFGAATPYVIGNLGRGIVQGDFDGDDILDLAATEYLSGSIAVLKGLGTDGVGNGAFGLAVHYPAGPEPVDIDVCDYDADGNLDLLVANGTNAGTRVLHGNGTGGFAIVASLASGNTASASPSDVNEDGRVDIVALEVQPPIRNLRVYHGNGTGSVGDGSWSLAATIPLTDDPYQVTFGDLTGDTHPEAVVTGYTSTRVTVFPWDCREVLPDPRRPDLTRVRDVPADQGGRVYLTWLRSSLDVPGGSVNAYRVWRQIPEEEFRRQEPVYAAASSGAPATPAATAPLLTTRLTRGRDGMIATTFWEALATLPAQRLEGYGYTAATTEDSTEAHPAQATFFVSALTANIDVFYDSDPVSGASVDNLAPAPPANFRIEDANAATVVLAWSGNTEADLASYRLERSLHKAFPPDQTTVVDGLADTTHASGALMATTYYRLAAYDVHGNPSPWSPTLIFGGVGAGEGPAVLALVGARPNPARAGDFTLHFSLAGGAPASLEVFDVRGRRVAAPSLDGLGAGPHALRLNGHVALAPGVYVVRLTEGERSIERKVALAR